MGPTCFPETLFETEAFGHRKGSFTGAVRDRRGIFEVAHGGTLFLDEIGELGTAPQVILLRAIEEGEIRPVGAERAHHVDVRLVCSTNRDLRRETAAGMFRGDLYWRIRGVEIHMPPLRERGDDIVLLARYFAGPKPVSPQAATVLFAYPWPGNVRELQHAMLHATELGTGPQIRAEDFPPDIFACRAPGRRRIHGPYTHLPNVHELGRWYAHKILDLTAGNRRRAQASSGSTRKRFAAGSTRPAATALRSLPTATGPPFWERSCPLASPNRPASRLRITETTIRSVAGHFSVAEFCPPRSQVQCRHAVPCRDGG